MRNNKDIKISLETEQLNGRIKQELNIQTSPEIGEDNAHTSLGMKQLKINPKQGTNKT